ncbi:hypothetical protein GGS24DRAFT_506074 [Hypoxylon argillaceum]|nr:hypothetical protein GGS24DRAFT_506074 [Hypoxylon argillaceum]
MRQAADRVDILRALAGDLHSSQPYIADSRHAASNTTLMEKTPTTLSDFVRRTRGLLYPGQSTEFAINVSSADDIIAGVNFAQENNIRIIVKNTGYEFLGRSSGEGALSLWTHNLKPTTTIAKYTSPSYRGPAMRIGGGITNIEMYIAAQASGYRAVGAPILRSGREVAIRKPVVSEHFRVFHSSVYGPLGSTYGLGADQVLEYELVTATGKHIVASPSSPQYADLYWAVAGGGAGNYAIIVRRQLLAGHLSLAKIPARAGQDRRLRYAVGVHGPRLPARVRNAPGRQRAEVAALNRAPQLLSHYAAWATQFYDTNNSIGGRLILRSTVRHNLPVLVAAFADIAVNSSSVGGSAISGILANVTHARVGNTPTSNSVLPAWRDALFTGNSADNQQRGPVSPN